MDDVNEGQTSATGHLFTRAELAAKLGVEEHRVRNLVRAHDLIELMTPDGKRIPEYAMLQGEAGLEVNPALRGTVLALLDNGLTVAEASEWLASENGELTSSPLAALHAGHIHGVRRAILSTAL